MRRRALLLVAAGLAMATGAQAAPPPNAAHGAGLFAARCTACHSLGLNRVGPRLGGVVGRRAGSVADYDYSPALKASGIVWTPATLDRWLAGPGRFVPGARMPVAVPDAPSRSDIIAFLSQSHP